MLLVQIVVAVGLLYHYFLLIAGRRPRRSVTGASLASTRFAIAVPAHNEASVIATTVTCLRQMDYPQERFDVHVVADHCSDATAQVARSAGAIVHERSEGPRGRKGYALAWLFAELLQDPKHYDAIAVFDADSLVAPEFLNLMDRAFAEGAQVAQGRHVISNPDASVLSRLADADMCLNNRIRNQAKENLGVSARLMGDGMCFRREVLEAYPFGTYSLTEDREYGIYLVTRGLRVRFVPEAVSRGQATARWGDATGQRLRWYGGVFALQKRYVGPLLAATWKRHSLDALDSALELLLPPFSVLSVLAAGLAVSHVVLWALRVSPSFTTSAFLVVMAALYPVLGLLAERAPWQSFLALIYGPIYALWRVWLGLTVRVRRGQVSWIRTRRAEEEELAR